jgi:hypothetical protein
MSELRRYKIYKYVAFDGCCDKFSIITMLQKGFAGLTRRIYKYVAFDGCCDKFSIITTLQKGFAGLCDIVETRFPPSNGHLVF